MSVSIDDLYCWCDKNGFFCETSFDGNYVVQANPLGDDGEIDTSETVEWISYNEDTDSIRYMNTDHNNMWLGTTRPELSPEDIYEMFTELAHILNWEDLTIEMLIDPEDWQDIANVQDAYSDGMYTSVLF